MLARHRLFALVSLAAAFALLSGIARAAAAPALPGAFAHDRVVAMPRTVPGDGSTAGLPQRDVRLGKASATVVVELFADPQCPFCRDFSQQALARLIARHVRTGEVELCYRLLTFIGRDSRRAALFAAGAARQNKLWPFMSSFYANQGQENSGYVTARFLSRVGATVPGLDVAAARAAAGTAAARAIVTESNRLATRLGVSGVPAFAVGPRDGDLRVVSDDANVLRGLTAAIDAARQRPAG